MNVEDIGSCANAYRRLLLNINRHWLVMKTIPRGIPSYFHVKTLKKCDVMIETTLNRFILLF
jgi:hypothetical protein